MHLFHKWEYFVDQDGCRIVRSKQCTVCMRVKVLGEVIHHDFGSWQPWDFSAYQLGKFVGNGVGQHRFCKRCNFEETRETT